MEAYSERGHILQIGSMEVETELVIWSNISVKHAHSAPYNTCHGDIQIDGQCYDLSLPDNRGCVTLAAGIGPNRYRWETFRHSQQVSIATYIINDSRVLPNKNPRMCSSQ